MDRGTWWATVHGVTKSQTGQKGLSKQENIRKNQTEILQLKNTLNEMENAMESYLVEKHLIPQEGQVRPGKALPFVGKGLHPVIALTLASYSLETDAIITWNTAMRSGNTNEISD